jgi:ABC-type transport system involved in multi-copper enzyme maturation permease subunit
MSQQNSTTEVSLEGNKVPTSMTQIGIITKYEMRNYFRSRRFFILLGLGLAIEALLTFLVYHDGGSSGFANGLQFYSTWWGDSATYIVIFCAIFFGGDAISGEFQNKTGYFLVGNPIRRASIYIGKWFAATAASLIIVGIGTAICLANGLHYFGTSVPYQFGESWIFTLVFLIAALGLTFLFSCTFKSSSFSILVSVILLLFGFTVIQELLDVFVHIEPWFLLSYGSQIIGNVLMATYPAHTTTGLGFGGRRGAPISVTMFNATVPEGLAIMLVYFAVTAVLGLVLFERKEFN